MSSEKVETNIEIKQKVTKVVVDNAKTVGRTATEITWLGNIQLFTANGKRVRIPAFNRAVERSKKVTLEELDAQAKVSFEKSAKDLNESEERSVLLEIISGKAIAALKDKGATMSAKSEESLTASLVKSVS